MNTVLLTYPPESALAELPVHFPEVTFHFAPLPEEQHRLLSECQVLVCAGRAFTPQLVEAIKRSKSLRWIQMCSAGIDFVLNSGLPAWIRISRGGGLWNVSVAEHALSMMLALARHLPAAERERHQRIWNSEKAIKRIGTLEGKQLLVMGFGEIGLSLAKRAVAFDMKVTGIRRSSGPVEGFATYKVGDLHRLLPHADILVITLPGGPQTHRIVGKSELSLLPPGALLVNVGRGTVVDTDALVEALQSVHLAGAGLDVTDPEPLPENHPLWNLTNVIITPHVGGDTPRWAEKIAALVRHNLARYLAGQSLAYEITGSA